jgi:cyclopropane-fatty-acyl-phospholipid synthase
MRAVDRVLERGVVPERLLRAGIRANLAQRLRTEHRKSPSERRAFVDGLRTSPIALQPAKANEQHYEEPAEFFELVLGPRLKYSSCLWEEGTVTLADAEEAMLAQTCQRAQIADGMEILDLGCGWGSLSLYVAEHFPDTRVTAVSNSRTQREWIERQIEARALGNVRVLTADVNTLELDRRFDRVVSIEMFEHMRNYEALIAKIAAALEPEGRLFVHVFCHRELAYPYAKGWMERNFFTAGQMPSADLLLEFQGKLEIEERWLVSGTHYARTSEAWLERLAENADDIERRWGRSYLERWRVFFLACAELFAYRGGREWLVAHYLFGPRTP